MISCRYQLAFQVGGVPGRGLLEFRERRVQPFLCVFEARHGKGGPSIVARRSMRRTVAGIGFGKISRRPQQRQGNRPKVVFFTPAPCETQAHGESAGHHAPLLARHLARHLAR